MNFGGFLGFIGRVVVTNLQSDWSMLPRGRFKLHHKVARVPFDSSCQIPVVRKSYDYDRAAI